MRAATQTMKFTALYERLSRDDELIGESNSIKNYSYICWPTAIAGQDWRDERAACQKNDRPQDYKQFYLGFMIQ